MTKQSGFSLIELSIYLFIVGLITITIIPVVTTWMARARRSKTESELVQLQTAIQQYQLDIGQLPKKLEDLINRPAEKEIAAKWPGAYISRMTVVDGKIVDPWKEPYHYQPTKGKQHPFELSSGGDPDASEPFKIDVWTIQK